jgi:serine phosphatase RsbU (regulator of sigma subunit)
MPFTQTSEKIRLESQIVHGDESDTCLVCHQKIKASIFCEATGSVQDAEKSCSADSITNAAGTVENANTAPVCICTPHNHSDLSSPLLEMTTQNQKGEEFSIVRYPLEEGRFNTRTFLDITFPQSHCVKPSSQQVHTLIRSIFMRETQAHMDMSRLTELNREMAFYKDLSGVLTESADIDDHIDKLMEKMAIALNSDLVMVKLEGLREDRTLRFSGDREAFEWLVEEFSGKKLESYGFERGVAYGLFPFKCRHDTSTHFLLVARNNKPFDTYETRLIHGTAQRIANLDTLHHLLEEKFKSDILQRDLEIARTIHQKLLPVGSLVNKDLSIHGSCFSANYLGGDALDYFLREDGTYIALILDVSGHSINTSILMTTTRGYFKSLLSTGAGPGEATTVVNDLLCGDIKDAGMFVTGIVFELDPEKNLMRICNMGHHPFHLILSDGTMKMIPGDSMPIGIEAGQTYNDIIEEFPAGSTIFACTDGIIEAMTRDGTRFGDDRLSDCIKTMKWTCARELNDGIMDCFRAHLVSDDLQDDLTILSCVRKKESSPESLSPHASTGESAVKS